MGDLIERKTAIKAVKNYGKDAISAGRRMLDPVDDTIELCNMIKQLPAALHSAEPEMRPLTLEEVRAHCAKGPDDEPLWAEFREECAISRWIFAVIPPDVFDRPVISEWIATDRSEKYGKEWRCWPRKPTPEQMAAEKWKWEE